MTREADSQGTDADEARAWEARLGWAFGLIADDPTERAAALTRLADAQRNVGEAIRRFNAVWYSELPVKGDWYSGRTAGGEKWQPSPAYWQAHEAHLEAQRHSLPEALWQRPPEDIRTWHALPYALLFLEWEARYPQEWTRHAKKWGTKQGLIRDVAVVGHDETTRTKLIDLVEIVVQRAYRCKDREYVRVARAVDGADLRGRLEPAARSDNPWARRHAGYVLWLLDRPEVPNTIRVWQDWLERWRVSGVRELGGLAEFPE